MSEVFRICPNCQFTRVYLLDSYKAECIICLYRGPINYFKPLKLPKPGETPMIKRSEMIKAIEEIKKLCTEAIRGSVCKKIYENLSILESNIKQMPHECPICQEGVIKAIRLAQTIKDPEHQPPTCPDVKYFRCDMCSRHWDSSGNPVSMASHNKLPVEIVRS